MIRRLVFIALIAFAPFATMATPAAFPATEPGVTELKTLPAGLLVRSETGGDYFENGGGLFRPLFRYIQRKDIAMTTPVEVGVGAPSAMYFWIAEAERPKAEPDLLPTATVAATPSAVTPATTPLAATNSPIGSSNAESQSPRQSMIDNGSRTESSQKKTPEGVVVMTRPERLVVSHGGRGSYTREHFEAARAAALAWLAARSDLVVDGEACAVYWNGPFVPGFMKRYEVHIPVRLVVSPTS